MSSALVVALASSVLPYSLDPAVAALAGFLMLDQDVGAHELLAIAMVIVAGAGAASLSHR
jgi:inner membrane transporter RhtA